MDKKQQLEEMSGKIYVALISHDYKSNYFNRFFIGCKFDFVAEALYDAGYRKQGDVVREFAGKLLEKIQPFCFSLIWIEIKMIIMETVGEFCAKGE